MKSLADREPCGVLPEHSPASHGRAARAGPCGAARTSSAGVRPGAAFWPVASPRLHPQRSGDAFPARLAADIAAGKVIPGAVSRVPPCAAGMLQAGWWFPAHTAASVGAAQAGRGHIATVGMCSSCGIVQSPCSPRSDPCGAFYRARGPSKRSAFHALCCCC